MHHDTPNRPDFASMILAVSVVLGICQAQDFETLEVGENAVHRTVLDNGLRVLVLPAPEHDKVNIALVYAAGTRHESPETSGLAHLTEHVMFSGSERLADEEFVKTFEEMGAEANAYTRADYTLYYDQGVPVDKVEFALELEAERLAHLAFDPDGFEREWKSLLNEERRTTSDGERRIGELRSLVFSAHPYGIGVKRGEVHTNSENLTLEQSREFQTTHYRVDRAVLAITGAIEPGTAFELARKTLGAVPRPEAPWQLEPAPEPPAAPARPRRARITLGEDPSVIAGAIVPGILDPEAPVLHVLAVALDLCLPDGVGAGLETRLDPYIFVISAGRQAAGGSDDPEEIAKVMEEGLAKFLKGEVDDDFFQRAKKEVATRYSGLHVVDRPYFALGTELAILDAAGDVTLATRWQELVEAVTERDVVEAARRLLGPENRFTLLCDAGEKRRKPFLGVRASDAESTGARLEAVIEDTPAQRAGLVVGDIVLAIDGEPVEGEERLLSLLAARAAGDVVLLELAAAEEGAETRRMPVQLGERPEAAGASSSIEMLNEARDASRRQDTDRARELYRALFERSDDRIMKVIYMTELGSVELEAGEYDEAIADLERGLAVVDYPATREIYDRAVAARDAAAPASGSDEPAATATTRPAASAGSPATGSAEIRLRFQPGGEGSRVQVEVLPGGEVEVKATGVDQFSVETGAAIVSAPTGSVVGAAPAVTRTSTPASVDPVAVTGHDATIDMDVDGDRLVVVDRLLLASADGGRVTCMAPEGATMKVKSDSGEALQAVASDSEDPWQTIEAPAGVEAIVLEYSLPLTSVAEVDQGVFLGGWWLPRLDGDPLVTHRVKVTTPAGWESVTDGVRRRVDDRTTIWTSNHPSDGLTVMAGPYEVVERQHGDVWIYAYFYAEDLHLAAGYVDATARYLDLYSELLGPYPYRKFAVVENFLPTGYGYPSWTLLGRTVVALPFITETSLGHEICHNWWGNGVFVDRSEGNWCEGLTTYCADHLYKEREDPALGASYRKAILEKYAAYVPAGDEMPLSEFSSRTDDRTQATGYGRVAMLFHELRQISERQGQDFFAMLRDIATRCQFERITWSDWADEVGKALGMDLRDWFKSRIESQQAPVLELLVRDDGRAVAALGHWPGAEPAPMANLRIEEGGQTREILLELSHPGADPVWTEVAAGARVVLDPDFDLFRRLDPREIDPTVAQVKGDDESLAVFNGTLERDAMIAYGKVAAALGISDHRRWRTTQELDLAEVRGGASVLFGIDSSVEGFEFLAAHDDVVTPGDAATGARAGRAPDDPGRFFLQVMSDTPAASESLANKLPHYGKYSHVSFTEEGRVLEKRVVPSVDSPLDRQLP